MPALQVAILEQTPGAEMKVVAVIPCYNEGRHIGDVIDVAKKHVYQVGVSDDGSTDDTALVALEHGAFIVCNHSGQRGTGAAVSRGIAYARRNSWPDVIVLMDGDGQHDPEDIPRLLAPIQDGRADAVAGVRLDGNMPRYRRFGNRILSWLANIGFRQALPDAMTGYWAVRCSHLPTLEERGWGFAIELLMSLRASGARLEAVPVRAVYHARYGDNSSVAAWRLGIILLWKIVKWRWRLGV